MPTGGITLVVEGDNHGQYVAVSEKAGSYIIPEVQIEGTIEAESQKNETEYKEDKSWIKR